MVLLSVSQKETFLWDYETFAREKLTRGDTEDADDDAETGEAEASATLVGPGASRHVEPAALKTPTPAKKRASSGSTWGLERQSSRRSLAASEPDGPACSEAAGSLGRSGVSELGGGDAGGLSAKRCASALLEFFQNGASQKLVP